MPKAKIFNDRRYQSEGQKGNSVYYRCNFHPYCYGRGLENENGFQETKPHTCDLQLNAQRIKDFHDTLKSKMTKHAKPQRVYEEVAKDFEDVAEDFPYASKRKTMQKTKKTAPTPKIDCNGIRGLYETLNIEEWTDRLAYTGGKLQLDLVTDRDGVDSLIIWDPKHFNTYNDSEMIAIDGTFSRVPLIDDKKLMKNYQLMTVIAVKENVALQKRAQKMKIWKKIKDDPVGRLILRRFMMLALLPTAKIPAAFEEIVKSLSEKYSRIFNSRRAKFSFLNYMRETWIYSFRLDHISVYRTTHRTNNIVESYHAKLRHRLVKRPTAWAFIEEIVEITTTTSRNSRSMAKGINVKVAAPRSLSQITELTKQWDELDAGVLSTAQFLLNVNHIIQKRSPRMKIVDELEISSDESDNEDELFSEEEFVELESQHFHRTNILSESLDNSSQSSSVSEVKALSKRPAMSPKVLSSVSLNRRVLIQKPKDVAATITSGLYTSSNSRQPSIAHHVSTHSTSQKVSTRILTTHQVPITSTPQDIHQISTKSPRIERLQLELFEKNHKFSDNNELIKNVPTSARQSEPVKRMRLIKVPASKCLNLINLTTKKTLND